MEAAKTQSRKFAASLWRTRGEPGDLIPLLQAAQEAFGYVPERVMENISAVTGIPASQVFGVVTFYSQFRLQPKGRYVLKVCNGTACHVNGSSFIEDKIAEYLRIARGETDSEGFFTLESVNCLGCCSLAPAVMVNDDTYGSLNPRKMVQLLKKLRRESKEAAS
jgi:NADH:ubiquinone oxidoreductase subunit E